jgi:hypothetical protein
LLRGPELQPPSPTKQAARLLAVACMGLTSDDECYALRATAMYTTTLCCTAVMCRGLTALPYCTVMCRGLSAPHAAVHMVYHAVLALVGLAPAVQPCKSAFPGTQIHAAYCAMRWLHPVRTTDDPPFRFVDPPFRTVPPVHRFL